MQHTEYNLISDIINELKRLQVEHGDIPVMAISAIDTTEIPAWPIYNEKEDRIEF